MSDSQLKRSVERRLKQRVFVGDSEASLRVRIAFTAHDGETEARIELSSIDGTPRGTRSLVTAGHCSALDDSLALSIALLVDEPPDPITPKLVEMVAEPSSQMRPPRPQPYQRTRPRPPPNPSHHRPSGLSLFRQK